MGLLRNIRHSASVVLAFMWLSLKSRWVDRGDFLIGALSIALHQGLGIAFLGVVFGHIPYLAGWEFPEVLFVFGAFHIVTSLFYFFFSWTLWFSDLYLVNRRLDAILCRPVPALLQIVSEGAGRSLAELPGLVFGAAILAYAANRLALEISPLEGVAFALLLLAGAAILGGLFTLLALSAFWFGATRSAAEPLLPVLDFAQYPLTIYAGWLRFVFTFLLPLGAVSYWPSAWFLRADPASLAWVAIPWIFGLWATVCVTWRIGVRRYQSAGT